MTVIRTYEYECSNCGEINSVETEDSITTWLYPELVKKVLNDSYFFICKKCNQRNPIEKNILVNARKGMFNLDTGISLEEKRKLFIQYGIIDQDGNILKQKRIDPEKAQNDPEIDPMIKALDKVVKDFRDELLSDKKKNND
jgi:hypothetical protein